jgi:hypothetical protein
MGQNIINGELKLESVPNSSTKKQEIIDWLISHNIEFSDGL